MKTMIRLGLVMVMGLIANGLRADDGANKVAAVSTPATQGTPAPKAKHARKATAAKKAKSEKKSEAAQEDSTQYVWVCAMCEFTSTKPGKCPTCGMDLVKVKKSDLKKQ